MGVLADDSPPAALRRRLDDMSRECKGNAGLDVDVPPTSLLFMFPPY